MSKKHYLDLRTSIKAKIHPSIKKELKEYAKVHGFKFSEVVSMAIEMGIDAMLREEDILEYQEQHASETKLTPDDTSGFLGLMRK